MTTADLLGDGGKVVAISGAATGMGKEAAAPLIELGAQATSSISRIESRSTIA
jgi:NAD(P)-dependent dehydrogenase (short-subunit alcohol dehydrogenase family)